LGSSDGDLLTRDTTAHHTGAQGGRGAAHLRQLDVDLLEALGPSQGGGGDLLEGGVEGLQDGTDPLQLGAEVLEAGDVELEAGRGGARYRTTRTTEGAGRTSEPPASGHVHAEGDV